MDDRTLLGVPLISSRDQAPTVGGKLAYYIFFLLGLGAMLPWNAFITAHGYFQSRLQDTPFAHNFENFFSVGFTGSNLLSLLLLLRFPNLVPQSKGITGPLVLNVISFSLITVLVMFPPEPLAHFAVVMCCVVFSGVCNAALGGGLFGLAAKFPPKYTQALCAGQAWAGLAVTAVNVSTTIATPPDKAQDINAIKIAALIYFVTVVITLILCIIGYRVLSQTPVYQHYSPRPIRVRRLSSIPRDPESPPAAPEEESITRNGALLRKVGSEAFTVWFVFMVTLCLFPALTTSIDPIPSSPPSRFAGDLFAPLSFLNFNFGDFLGRLLASYDSCSHGPRLVAASLGRLMFVPLFLLCNVHGSSIPTPFHNNWWPVVIMQLFAITNGHVSTMAMMKAPSKVKGTEQNSTGVLMNFCLQSGLASGSALSFLLRGVMCSCNPFLE